MVPFFIQIKCKMGQSYAVANALAEAEIASEIYSTAGDYDLLVKYLHQHLPELRDVGEGFPSPAEFTARAYESLSFERLHGGRVVALHGLVPAAGERPPVVEVSWLTGRGFDHADTIPCDADGAYFGRAVNDELIEVTVAWQQKPHTHRLSIRGHA